MYLLIPIVLYGFGFIRRLNIDNYKSFKLPTVVSMLWLVGFQRIYYSNFTVLCLGLLLVSQFPYVRILTCIYVVITVLVGLRQLGECSSQMIRPVTLILRLLVKLSFAYLVTLTLASQLIEEGIFIFCFLCFISSMKYLCFLLTYVSQLMLLSLIINMYHVLCVKIFSS
ncbi:unnamed protein product [Protopolystoma xenopodis]|uniref:Uncharacterized protein n=1 Tax=Protopolystoma xenopodis TaxID=117903 RepID=A0A448WE72_9PLAT|nr:unnamed protein product [Protopolystoma xenopodis]